MKKLLLTCALVMPILFVFSYSSAAFAAAEADQELTDIIQQCEACHAPGAPIGSSAPVLNGMQRNYLEEQLQNFRHEKRGAGEVNRFTSEMLLQAKALSEDQLNEVARHYARQQIVRSDETVAGNSNNGAILFEESCAGCHTSSMGRMFTRSPPITHLEGSYILKQLQSFAADRRHFHKENKHKIKMIEVAKQFNNSELLDITAYIKSKFQ